MENPYRHILGIKAPALTPAKEALHKTLLEMMVEQPVESIPVKELCRRAHVSRNTYYAYYHHVDEILEEIEDEILCRMMNLPIIYAEELLSAKNGGDYAYLLDFENFCAFTMDNRSTLYPLMIARPSWRFVIKWTTANKYRFYEKLKPDYYTDQLDLRLHVIVHALLALQTQILKDSLDIDNDSIYSIIASIVRILDDKNQP